MLAEARFGMDRHETQIPLVVAGALRAGGSGKTCVVAALARAAAGRGLRPAILAYRLGPSGAGEDGNCLPVRGDSDWRESSDEAVMLRRSAGVPVFATRHRARAREILGRAGPDLGGPFDLLLSDDGFQDPRLRGAFRILLQAPGEDPGLRDLLPGGPYRETARARARADLVLRGPLIGTSPEGGPAMTAAIAGGSREGGPPVAGFRRRLLFPPGFDRDAPWIVLCGLGNNARFLADLRREGVRTVAALEAGDHASVPWRRLDRCLDLHPGAGLLCTAKDAVKLEDRLAGGRPPALEGGEAVLLPRDAGGGPRRVAVIGSEAILEPRAWSAVEGYLRGIPGN
jgi:tetraacyldisaccharide 4'-kinase